LYSLFVERAQSLIKPDGLVALLTPSGIAADKGAAAFFRSIATTQRLGGLFDFENRKVFFADVHASFKFCALVFGGPQRKFGTSRCAFFLHQVAELSAVGRELKLEAADFILMNPNTGAAPVFRAQRDLDITRRVYAQHPVLVRHGTVSDSLGRLPAQPVWPVTYTTAFHMTSDSAAFRSNDKLRAEGFSVSELGRWRHGARMAWPLYEGKMVQMFDHRAADVVLNTANLKRAAQQQSLTSAQKQAPDRFPAPQYWVRDEDLAIADRFEYCMAYKSVTAPSNMRTMIAAYLPASGVGNSMALLRPTLVGDRSYPRWASILLANLNAFAYDFLLRQKVQGQNLNWFIVEQSCVINAQRFSEELPATFAAHLRSQRLMNGHHPQPSIADFVIPQVLALSYTAHDLAPLAHDLGYVDAQRQVLPPFVWNDEDRRQRLAALDALFFHLYGLGLDDAAYVMDTFPIVRQQDEAAFSRFRTRDDVLALLPLLKESPPV
jgi:hypothetical protein